MARRKRRARRAVAAPRRTTRRRRSWFRRNPAGFSVSGITKSATQGVIDAGELIVGKTASRLVRGKLGFAGGTTIGAIVEFVTALAGGQLVGKYDGNFGKMFIAGGIAAPLESVVKSLNLPFISSALGDEGDLIEVGLAGAYADDGLGGVYNDALPAGGTQYVNLGDAEVVEA